MEYKSVEIKKDYFGWPFYEVRLHSGKALYLYPDISELHVLSPDTEF